MGKNAKWNGMAQLRCVVKKKVLNQLIFFLQYDKVFAAFGIHPHYATVYTDEIENQIIESFKKFPEKSLAWGECGLDFHYNNSPPDVQKQIFTRQVIKAVEINKPIIVHTREADDDTLRILQENVPRHWRIHVHCFTGSTVFAQKLLDAYPNLFIGFTGVITFKNSQDIRESVKIVPLERLLLETDGPFMAPIPYRGKVAHSGHIPLVAQMIAEVKNVSVETVFEAARANTKKMYGI